MITFKIEICLIEVKLNIFGEKIIVEILKIV